MTAERPWLWVTTQEVKEYTEFESVQQRSDERLEKDIFRAQQYVIAYTHNDFRTYREIPEPVKTAVILISEAYARNAYLYTVQGEMKSETFDDYSYTKAGTAESLIDIDGLDLKALLDPWVVAHASGNVFMRLRKL